MTDSDWQDMIVGDRMAVDREFAPRVADSRFSSQQWGLIMTATEFRIEHAADADRARLVADTGKVEHVLSELQDMEGQAGAMGVPGGGRGDDSSGFLGSVKDALGLGRGGGGEADRELLERADALTGEYAGLLQDRLENEGKWAQIRSLAAQGGGSGERDSPGEDDAGES